MAARLRPASLGEVLGQDGLLGAEGGLRRQLEAGHLPSLLLWGPPGCGKTTIARLLAEAAELELESISAADSGVKRVREILAQARQRRHLGRGTLLFLDEIHRFSKAQQDALLSGVEEGLVTLVGATTENPAFEVNDALLSRMVVHRLEALDEEALNALADRACSELGVELETDGRELLVSQADGDGRALLTLIEAAAAIADHAIDAELIVQAAGRRLPRSDKDGDGHYQTISALIKSMRASDVDASLYWLARMLEGGQEPRFVARRLVIFASEDVGLADPRALHHAVAVAAAVDRIGMPEAFYALAQGVVMMARSPKSRLVGEAYSRALDAVRSGGSLPVPLHLRNLTRLDRSLGLEGDDDPTGNLPSGLDKLLFWDQD